LHLTSTKFSKSLEIEWKGAIENIEKQIVEYRAVFNQPKADPERKAAAVEGVAAAMEEAAESHNDPKVKQYWTQNAQKFRGASDEFERESLLEDVVKGIALIIGTPFALVGAALMAAGMILEGITKVLKGLGLLFIKGFLSTTGRKL